MRRTPLLAIAALAAMLVACRPKGKTDEAFRPIAVGELVPDFAVRTLAGDSARVTAARHTGPPARVVRRQPARRAAFADACPARRRAGAQVGRHRAPVRRRTAAPVVTPPR